MINIWARRLKKYLKNHSPVLSDIPDCFKLAVESQMDLVWEKLLYGKISMEWVDILHQHCDKYFKIPLFHFSLIHFLEPVENYMESLEQN